MIECRDAIHKQLRGLLFVCKESKQKKERKDRHEHKTTSIIS